MNLAIACGNPPNIYKYNMSAQQRYHAEQVYNVLAKKNAPLWILLDDIRIQLTSDNAIKLACEMVVVFHNRICFSESDFDNTISEPPSSPEDSSSENDQTPNDDNM